MKVLIITGNKLRHQFFAKALSKALNVVGVIYEKKANKHEKKDFGEEGNDIIKQHFVQRGVNEQKYFSDEAIHSIDIENQKSVPTGKANSQEIFEWINALNPDIIQLFGSSIIKEHILNRYRNRVVNIHLGLSPYYRGSGTNFWPLVHKKVECVGATIHLAVLDVDAGGVLHQVRPIVSTGDTPHDVGNKTILAGIKAIPTILKKYYDGKIEPLRQDLSKGIVCYRRDLTVEAVEKLYKNFSNALLAKFLEEEEIRKSQYPIVENM